jgi:ABC-type polysaccharide/polyol phosphate transport system ATPase subunit
MRRSRDRLPAPVPGEIVLRAATRTFSVRADQAGTLKGLLLGKRVHGPASVPALTDVSLHIRPGETVGMVGRNGAGKTSTLRVLAGIVPLQSGDAACGGRIVSLLELGAGFSRDFSGRENIYLQGALFGFDREQIEERLDLIIAFSEIGEFIDVPVKTYSAGMFLRLGFSIAAHLDADVLLIDEVLAVGDEAFQRKCLRRISEQIAGGATLLLVSHDLAALERICERVVVLDRGHIVFDGPTTEGLAHYRRLSGTEHGGGESYRPSGPRAIEVVDVELRDAASRSSNIFRAGSPLQVHVVLQARRELNRPWLALELRADGGTLLHRSTTELALAPDGAASLVFEVPDLALLGGDYDLVVGAGEASEQTPLERSIRFSVAREPGPEGVLDLHGSWRSLAATEGVR